MLVSIIQCSTYIQIWQGQGYLTQLDSNTKSALEIAVFDEYLCKKATLCGKLQFLGQTTVFEDLTKIPY